MNLFARFDETPATTLQDIKETKCEGQTENSIPATNTVYGGINTFLAHRIRISEILTWDRKSYLTQAILPRLSREGYIHWLYWNSRTWSSSDVNVMFK